MTYQDALRRRFSANQDPRGKVGILSRGKNIYNGGSSAAHSGGGIQYGRPSNNAIRRRQQGSR